MFDHVSCLFGHSKRLPSLINWTMNEKKCISEKSQSKLRLYLIASLPVSSFPHILHLIYFPLSSSFLFTALLHSQVSKERERKDKFCVVIPNSTVTHPLFLSSFLPQSFISLAQKLRNLHTVDYFSSLLKRKNLKPLFYDRVSHFSFFPPDEIIRVFV